MVRRLATALVLELAIFAALLFGGAGTVLWPAGWLYLALFLGCALMMSLRLMQYDPGLLEERMKPLSQQGQPLWDKIFLGVLIPVYAAWLFVMGLDAVRYGWSHMAPWLSWLGIGGFIAGNAIVDATFRANPFTAPVVRVQHERHHQVVTTGPYRMVRHPMYAGASLFLVCTPLILGSWYGVAVAGLMVAAVCWRAVQEEKTLTRDLEGYAQYQSRVLYRILPGVW